MLTDISFQSGVLQDKYYLLTRCNNMLFTVSWFLERLSRAPAAAIAKLSTEEAMQFITSSCCFCSSCWITFNSCHTERAFCKIFLSQSQENWRLLHRALLRNVAYFQLTKKSRSHGSFRLTTILKYLSLGPNLNKLNPVSTLIPYFS